MDHAAREAGHDGFDDPVGLPGGIDVAASVQAGSVQPAGHGAYRHHCPARGELVTDTTGGPLVGAAPVLDEVHRLGTGPGGTVGWGAGAVLESLGSSLVVTSEPLRQRGAGDAGLGGYVGDRTTGLDTHHEPVAALRRQHSVTVGHGSGAFSCRKDDSAPPILTAQAPLPPRLQPHDPQQLSTIHRPHGARAPLSQRHTISDQPAQMPLPIDFADPLSVLPERDGA